MIKNTLLALAIAFAAVGCATSPLTLDFDYDTGKDFAAQKTFAWMPATGNAAANELLVKRIRSAVDKQLEHELRANVAAAVPGGTIVIITHRIETIMDADHAIHLHDGRVVAEGSAAAVLARMNQLTRS